MTFELKNLWGPFKSWKASRFSVERNVTLCTVPASVILLLAGNLQNSPYYESKLSSGSNKRIKRKFEGDMANLGCDCRVL